MQNQSPSQAGQAVTEINITPQMEKAGLQELYEVGVSDPAYLVRSIYMAMEFMRLEALGKL